MRAAHPHAVAGLHRRLGQRPPGWPAPAPPRHRPRRRRHPPARCRRATCRSASCTTKACRACSRPASACRDCRSVMPDRIALEGYPRRLAHALVERRSYKNTDDDDRRQTREAIVAGLESAAATAGLALEVDARCVRRSSTIPAVTGSTRCFASCRRGRLPGSPVSACPMTWIRWKAGSRADRALARDPNPRPRPRSQRRPRRSAHPRSGRCGSGPCAPWPACGRRASGRPAGPQWRPRPPRRPARGPVGASAAPAIPALMTRASKPRKTVRSGAVSILSPNSSPTPMANAPGLDDRVVEEDEPPRRAPAREPCRWRARPSASSSAHWRRRRSGRRRAGWRNSCPHGARRVPGISGLPTTSAPSRDRTEARRHAGSSRPPGPRKLRAEGRLRPLPELIRRCRHRTCRPRHRARPGRSAGSTGPP